MRDRERQAADSAFSRKKKRETEINGAVKQESVRHEAEMKNMERLRALRIERDANNQAVEKVKRPA
jgi:hypothetical protein